MADVNTGEGGGGHGKHEKKRAKKSSTRIDMTPMVDLAFLLLTFFVLTSTFNKAKTMEILLPVPPEDKTVKPPPINNALTFIMSGDNKLYYYFGEFYPAGNADGKPATTFTKTDYSKDGLHKVLLKYNEPTFKAIKEIEEKRKKGEIEADSTMNRLASAERAKTEALTVLIKADDKAVYKNIVDLIDELNVCQIAKQAIVDMSPQELEVLKASN
jgi:biopolymer transport protein ExbD